MRPTLRRDGQYTMSFMVDDVRRMFRRLKAAGVRTVSDAPVQVERGRWAAHVCYPDNLLVEIVEPGGNLSGTLRQRVPSSEKSAVAGSLAADRGFGERKGGVA